MTPTVPARVEPGRTEAAREDMAVIGLGTAEPPRDIIVSGNWLVYTLVSERFTAHGQWCLL